MNEIFNFKKLYRAYLDCRKTKRKSINALQFEWNFERNLFQLQHELEAKKYKPGRSICFVVENPTPREIFAATFRDRVVHHLLVREVEAMGEKSFIFDSFSCRKNKGTHSAIKRLKIFVKKATKNCQQEAFCLQLDISGFFMAINHRILYSLFEKLVSKHNKSCQWKEDILWLAKTIIFHNPTSDYIVNGNPNLLKLIPPRKSLFGAPCGKGLPIGNYSSQFFANLYLNELDQFIKRKIKCGYYIRYVDDLVLLDKNREKLKFLKNNINLFLKENLDLELNLNKIKLQSIGKGIDFLGYFAKLNYVLVRQKVVKRLKNKLYELNENGEGAKDSKKILAIINSYYGHFSHAFSFNLRKDISEDHLGELQKNFSAKNNYSFLKISR